MGDAVEQHAPALGAVPRARLVPALLRRRDRRRHGRELRHAQHRAARQHLQRERRDARATGAASGRARAGPVHVAPRARRRFTRRHLRRRGVVPQPAQPLQGRSSSDRAAQSAEARQSRGVMNDLGGSRWMQDIRIVASLVVMLTLSGGCAPATTTGAPSPTSTTLGRIRAKGELVVGTAASMPPLNMTTKTGEIIGLEVDLARSMADSMKVKLRLAPMPFANLLPALEAGQIDGIRSGMTMTPERNMKFAFVGPYLTSGKSFLAKEATVASSKGSADLNTPQMRLAALRGSTSEVFVQENMPKATLVSTKDYDEGIILLLQDKVDAMIADLPACLFAVRRYPDRGLYALETPLTYEPIGIALSGNDALLVNWTQNWLRELEATGTLERTTARWFQDTAW